LTMKIAITGGAGYIGSLLIKKLRDKNHILTSIDNQSIGDYKWLRATGVESLNVGDVKTIEDLIKTFKDADCVAHLAALPGLTLCNEKPEEACLTNIYGTHQILEAAKQANIKRVVFCSTAAVYGTPQKTPVTEDHPLRPMNLYGVTKLAGEKLMEAYHANDGLETVSLRFGNVYGVGLYTRWSTVVPKFVRLALENKPLTIYGDGTNSRDFVHVEDICQALELALTQSGVGGEVYNVGCEPTTIQEIAEVVSDEAEKSIGNRPEITYLPPRAGETKEFTYDLSKIRDGLDFKPEWTIRKGVQQLIQYYKKS